MRTEQFDKFNRYDGKCKARRDIPCDLFLLSWTLTPPTFVWGYALEANRNLEAALKELKIPNCFGREANLLYRDSVASSNVTDMAIQQNMALSSLVGVTKKDKAGAQNNGPRWYETVNGRWLVVSDINAVNPRVEN